ncbi:MAG: hypothetical protein ABJB86_04675 [Bacteroidota bacterium]
MKTLFLFLLTAISITVTAQYGGADNISGGSIRLGAGYVHDFPGLAGSAASLGYRFPLNEWLQGGIGAKHISTSGFPRTNTVREYTKANTIDFELLLVPLHTDNAALRIGLGYTFSFYNIRRSYPVYTTNQDKTTNITWPVTDAKGQVHGTSLIGEYEYCFGNSFSAGARVEVAKAYGYVVTGGPFVAIKL